MNKKLDAKARRSARNECGNKEQNQAIKRLESGLPLNRAERRALKKGKLPGWMVNNEAS